MKPKIDYTLYLVTDRTLMSSPTIEESVEQAVRGGCTLVQLREKESSSRDFYKTAMKLRELTTRLDVPLIVNDRVDIALAVGADGVHVGQDDLPVEVARQIIGPDKIIGVSASSLSEALKATEDGADYLGIGAMFTTDTKADAHLTAIEELQRIQEAVSLPIVVIGGISKETVSFFRDSGIEGLAVVSAIVAQKDIAGATQELKKLFLEGRTNV
jgi:thiamine-phosphate pyrophosphorylase